MLLLEGLMLSREMRSGLRIDQTRHWRSGGTGAGTTAADVIFTLSALLFFFYLFYFFDLFLLVLIKFHFHETYIIFFLIYRLTRRVTEKKKIVHKIRYFIHTIALLTPFSMIKLICQNAIFVAYLLKKPHVLFSYIEKDGHLCRKQNPNYIEYFLGSMIKNPSFV